MPPYKVPSTLFNLSVEKLAFWFINSWKCVEKECDPSINGQLHIFIRNWKDEEVVSGFTKKVTSLSMNIPNLFDDLPVGIFNELVSKITAAFSCRKKKFCLFCLRKLLTVILTKKLKHWDMKKFFRWYAEPYLIVIKSIITAHIPSMNNIVHLRVGLVCDDSILRCIGENCHLIEYLDIKFSDVSDEGLMYLIPSENSAGCPKLKELILGENEDILVSSHTVALLLKSLPDIVYINYYNMRPVLLELFNTNVLQLKRLVFIILQSPIPWNPVDIISLSRLCPSIEDLEIVFSTEESDLLALKHFASLSRLHVKYIPQAQVTFPVAEAKQYFKEHCMHLTSLRISCELLDAMCFSLLSKHCSSLTDLHIDCMNLCESERFTGDGENNLRILSTFTLEIRFLQNDSNLVMRDILYSILKSTCRLTEVTLELPARCLSHLDLQFLLDVVDVHLLRSLIIMRLFGDRFNLTMESVYLILGKCPLLKSLGCLGDWDVVYSNVHILRKDFEYSNYDIQID